MTPEDELDERWDGNLGFYHPSNQNEQQKEIALDALLQQNPNLNQSLKEVNITGHFCLRTYAINP